VRVRASELGYRAFTGALIAIGIGLSATTAWLAAKGASQIIILLLRASGWLAG
jgi:hypothetical protein